MSLQWRTLGFVAWAISWLVASSADATVISGPIVNPANGHSYYLLDESTWTDAEAEAITLGGHLATIDDSLEDTWVYTTFSTFGGVGRNLWIGLYDTDAASNSTNRATRRTEFAWISGVPVTYTNWSPVEPNNPASSDPFPPELYVHIWNPGDPNPGTWNNFVDASVLFGVSINGVVEVTPVPEPGTLAFLAIGAVGVFASPGRRRRSSPR